MSDRGLRLLTEAGDSVTLSTATDTECASFSGDVVLMHPRVDRGQQMGRPFLSAGAHVARRHFSDSASRSLIRA